MSTSLFSEFFPGEIIGVTGTRGKSTVTMMIYEILKAGIPQLRSGQKNPKIFLGGNVRGISTLAHLPESTEDEIAVLELDSWQLQGFGEAKISPHIAVFTTFFKDHLDYYKENLNAYMEDKANIFKYQTKDDFLILGNQCADLVKEKYPEIKSKIIIPNSYDISYELKVLGEHNRYNAACAREAIKALDIGEKTIKEALESFEGLEGRLQFIREVQGVKIYNDTTSTTPEATLAALEALASRLRSGQNQNIVLILGGSDKGLNFTELLEAIPRFCKALVLLPGTGTNKLLANSLELIAEESNLKNLKANSYKLTAIKVQTLQEAVRESIKISQPGDSILFSPAFASFGPPPGGFKNEFDRGDKFNEVINSL